MSSMHPRKGKKRLQPQTPSGKPLAKASRPSSPDYTAWMESQLGPKPTLSKSVPPAASFSQSTSGNPRTPPTPTRASSATPMVKDPRTPSPEPDSIAFTTVDTALNNAEAESSFKEILDWMRYLAQHKEQCGRLSDLLTAASLSLRELMGTVGMGEKATYAAAAAPSVPQPRLPKRVATAPTAKQTKCNIQCQRFLISYHQHHQIFPRFLQSSKNPSQCRRCPLERARRG